MAGLSGGNPAESTCGVFVVLQTRELMINVNAVGGVFLFQLTSCMYVYVATSNS